MILPALLFFWYLVTSMLQSPWAEVTPHIERKSALVLIPVLLLLAQSIDGVNLKWAMRGFISGLLISGIHMIVLATLSIFKGMSLEHWTYHAFTSPYHIGAIYYSWYLAIAILYLIFSSKDPLFEKNKLFIMLFLLILLLLSSSKLFIILTVPIVIWKLIAMMETTKGRLIAGTLIAAVLLLGSIPFIHRVNEISKIDKEVIFMEEYSYDTELNGITLRFIQWRLGIEIMGEQKAWIFGVSLADSQKLLNKKYKEYGLYTGNEDLGDSGYLDYNYHNQYIESMLASGVAGLTILLMILMVAIINYQKMLIFPRVVFLITAMFFMTESVLERQAGILVFCMMICFTSLSNSATNKLNVNN